MRTPHFSYSLLALMLLALASTRAARAEPLSAEEAASANAVQSERTPKTRNHYVLSNEWRQDLLAKALEKRGGAYLGVGADQNYTMAALAGSSMLWLVDFDATIPLVHKLYGVLVPASSSPDALIARFARDAEKDTVALLNVALGSDPDGRRVVRLYRAQREKMHRYLERVRTVEHGVSWLADAALYAHVQRLHAEHRVVARAGDLTGSVTLQAVAAAAKRLGQCFGVLYFSNAEQYFKYDRAFVANMDALPRCEGAIVVRSFTHQRIARAARDEWSYMTHDLADFVDRLHGPYRHSFTIVGDVLLAKAPYLGEDGYSYVNATTPRPFVPATEARKLARRERRAREREARKTLSAGALLQ